MYLQDLQINGQFIGYEYVEQRVGRNGRLLFECPKTRNGRSREKETSRRKPSPNHPHPKKKQKSEKGD